MQTKVTKKIIPLSLSNGRYSERKYRILEILDSMPSKDAKRFKKVLPGHLEITRQTFSNYCNAPLSSTQEIPFSVAYRIAIALDVPLLDLLSNPYKKAVSTGLAYSYPSPNVANHGLTL